MERSQNFFARSRPHFDCSFRSAIALASCDCFHAGADSSCVVSSKLNPGVATFAAACKSTSNRNGFHRLKAIVLPALLRENPLYAFGMLQPVHCLVKFFAEFFYQDSECDHFGVVGFYASVNRRFEFRQTRITFDRRKVRFQDGLIHFELAHRGGKLFGIVDGLIIGQARKLISDRCH